MAEQPFTIEATGTAEKKHFHYDGPFGPLVMEPATTHDGYTVTGPSIGIATLEWPPNRHPDRGDAWLGQRLEAGIQLEVEGRRLRLHRPNRILEITRSSRAIHISDDDNGDSLRIRLRGWSSNGFTLETASGTQLVRMTGRLNGVVFDGATPAHVATWLLTWGSGLHELLVLSL